MLLFKTPTVFVPVQGYREISKQREMERKRKSERQRERNDQLQPSVKLKSQHVQKVQLKRK